MKLMSIYLLLFSQIIFAQMDRSDPLFIRLYQQDQLLFEKGFNQCQLDISKDIVSDDLEFFHDQGGYQDKAMFIAAMKENICSSPDHKPIRKLIDESLEVFPLYKQGVLYAAIQKGIHEFYIKETNKEIYQTGVAKFNHLWVLNNKQWKLKRVLSFDHQASPSKIEKLNDHYPMPLFDKDEGVKELLKKHKIPSLGLGIIENGKIQQIRVYGEQKNGVSASKDSIFKVASLTKPIAALVALKLIDSGDLGLDEALYKYYVDADIADTKEIKMLTPRLVLSHQTGFPNWRYLDKENTLKFEFTPGTKYQYSGEGFEYLRKAIEGKMKKSFEDLATELIFKPLAMKDSHFYWDNDVNENSYAQEHDEFGKPIHYEKHKEANAAANLLTSIEDYSKFMVHILNGAGLSKQLYKEMISQQVNVKQNVDFGLGWEIYQNLGQKEFALQHSGGDYGIKTLSIILPKSKRGLLIFTNSENGVAIWGKIIREQFAEIGEKLVELNLQE